MLNPPPSVLVALNPDLRRLEMLRGAREPLTPDRVLELRGAIVHAQEELANLADVIEARQSIRCRGC